MARMRSMRLDGTAFLILLLLGVSCERESRNGAGALTALLIFDNASPEVREALTARVDFRINGDNFARWVEAQSNLEELSRAAIQPALSVRGNTVDRAVARLESSPLTRQAIESAGLSVRDFVLETIALAQATEAAQTGSSMSPASVPPENFQFVRRYSPRVLREQADVRVARAEGESHSVQSDVADALANQIEMDIQMRLDEAEHAVEMRLADVEMRREEAERAADARVEEAQRAAEMEVEKAQHEAEMRRAEAEARREGDVMSYHERARRERESMFRRGRFRLAPKRVSARDSVRDTVPTLR